MSMVWKTQYDIVVKENTRLKAQVGRLRELGKAILKGLNIHPEKCRGFEDPEDNYEKRTPEMEEWNAKVFAFGEALSDQEGS